jgi:hypothetical protein
LLEWIGTALSQPGFCSWAAAAQLDPGDGGDARARGRRRDRLCRPRNFATNVQGGPQFGFFLMWVVPAANVMAMLI